MSNRNLSRERIIEAFLYCSFEKSAGAASLQDIAKYLSIQKASIYNYFHSKDEMYLAAIEYCRVYLAGINFLPDEMMAEGKIYFENFCISFGKIIKRYVQIFESEPVFQIYSFLNSEKYFNGKALKVLEDEIFKVKSGILELIKGYENKNKFKIPENFETGTFVSCFVSVIFEQLDLYISNKKEIVRQNPECGVGSLFALPTDDGRLNNLIKFCEFQINSLINFH